MISVSSQDALPSPDALLKECLRAFQEIGGIRRCSLFLINQKDNCILQAGFDLRDPKYPAARIKIRLKDCPLLEQCIFQGKSILLKGPFDGGLPVLWEDIPDKRKISAIALIPFMQGQQCLGVAGLISEDALDDLLEMQFRSWQLVGSAILNILTYYFASVSLFKEKTELENILNGISHGIVIVDRNLKILRANSAMADMVGRGPPELLGVPYNQLCREAGILDESCPVKESITTGEITHAIKHCQVNAFEQDRYLKVSCFPQKNSVGEVTHAIVYIRDVSAIVRAEILQKDLTHMILHDIRNPLLAAARTLHLSVTGDHGWITRHHRNALAATKDSCELLLYILDDMLDVYSHESGELHLNIQQVEPQQFIQKAYKAIEALVYEKAIQVRFNLPESLPVFYGDETRLIRVMINLFDNAVKFSPKNSTVIVDAQVNPEGCIQISVTNSGRSIPREHLEKIFWKFYQVDKETGIKKAGLGLGLAFCRLAIEAHGGKIWAESPVNSDGQGSRFTFTIPIKTA